MLYARSDGMFNLKEYHTAIKTLSQKRGNANMFKSGTPLAQVLENKHSEFSTTVVKFLLEKRMRAKRMKASLKLLENVRMDSCSAAEVNA